MGTTMTTNQHIQWTKKKHKLEQNHHSHTLTHTHANVNADADADADTDTETDSAGVDVDAAEPKAPDPLSKQRHYPQWNNAHTRRSVGE
jgi:hypothetical protein